MRRLLPLLLTGLAAVLVRTAWWRTASRVTATNCQQLRESDSVGTPGQTHWHEDPRL